MGGKISPLIIVVVLAVVVVVGIFVFNIVNNTSGQSVFNNNEVVEENGKTTVNLNLVLAEDQMSGIIEVLVVTTDTQGVAEIKLPDGSVVTAVNSTEYPIESNGTYEVVVLMNNGEEITESIEVTDIFEASATNPYIPTGFEHVSGTTVETGFVISDSYGNEYVWVPVENGRLIRNTYLSNDYEETATTSFALVNSVGKYHGYYIGRYEASAYETNIGIVASTMSNKTPLTNIDFNVANNAANASYKYFKYGEDYPTALVNSYAWDTVLDWVDKSYPSYSSVLTYGNYSGEIYLTGTYNGDEVNKIFDLAGNVREWTTEIYKNTANKNSNNKDNNAIYRVVRGGGAALSKSPASHIGYLEDDKENYRGFRLILYKQN